MQEQRRQKVLQTRYQAAVESFVAKVCMDVNVIAVIVCGSLAYDTVWEKSDIDLTVIVRDQPLATTAYCLVEDDITINASILARSAFKRCMDRATGGSIMQAYLAKGRLVYTSDDSLRDYFVDFKRLGSQDIALTVMDKAGELIDIRHKCEKWLTVKKDLLYAQFYLLKAAEVMAQMEVCSLGEPPTRESVLRTMELAPELLAPFYAEALSHPYGESELVAALTAIDAFLLGKLALITRPIIDFMGEGQPKSVTMLARHFQQDSHFIIGLLDYLAEQQVLVKVAQTVRLTPKSRPVLEELAFLCLSTPLLYDKGATAHDHADEH